VTGAATVANCTPSIQRPTKRSMPAGIFGVGRGWIVGAYGKACRCALPNQISTCQ
jgi:hypothetical protein